MSRATHLFWMDIQAGKYVLAMKVWGVERQLIKLIFNIVLAICSVVLPKSILAADNCINAIGDTERLRCYDDQQRNEALEKQSNDFDGQVQGALQKRLSNEKRASVVVWTIIPHKSNYIMPVTYNANVNTDSYEPFKEFDPEAGDLDEVEAKYQISFKVPLVTGLLNDRAEIWFAYTQVAYWQLYNSDRSSPFRETNYEPEVLLGFRSNYKLASINQSLIVLGFNHQSNGRSKPLSKSWNRIVLNFIFEKENFVIMVKPWWRIPEDKEDDDNPDIDKYLGYGEITANYKIRKNVFGILLRNNFRQDNNLTTVQLDWSFPLNNRLDLYVQYFNGYGDGMVDYNNRNHRIGVGVMLSNWL